MTFLRELIGTGKEIRAEPTVREVALDTLSGGMGKVYTIDRPPMLEHLTNRLQHL
jgi:hypothetical protein